MPRTARAVPRVTVKSRHREDCKYVGDGNKITCSCPKQLVWSHHSKERRVTAETCDYEVAERKAREMEASFERAVTGKPAPEKKESVTVEDATSRYVASKQTEGVSGRHLLTLRKVAKDLTDYCTAHGLMCIRDVKLSDLESYRDSWKYNKNTAQKQQRYLVSVWKYALNHEWVERNIAASLGTIRVREEDRKPTLALNDEQFEQLLDAISKVNGKTTDTMRKRLRSLLLLQRWTGFAIRDACKLERKQIEPAPDNHGWHRVFIRRSKTGVPVYAALAGDIAAEILSTANDNKRYLFTSGSSDDQIRQAVQRFTELYVKLDAVADIRDEHGEHVWIHSHMLRDTYAVWLLEQGAPTEDVAALLGHSSIAVTEKHYLPWIESRARRMFARVKLAYDNWQAERKAQAANA